MFGKKKDEEKKLEEEQKKLEEQIANGEEGVDGLKNIGSATEGAAPTEPKPEDKPPEDKPTEEAPSGEEKPPEEAPPEPVPEKPEEPPAEPEPKPEEEKPKKKRKASQSVREKLNKQIETQKETMRELEKEKDDALKKGDELAGLIEDMTNEMRDVEKKSAEKPAAAPVQAAPDISPQLKALEEKTAMQMQTLQETIKAIAEKKQTDEKEDEEVAVTMKKMFDKRMKELSDKLEESKAKPALGGEGAPGAGPGGEAAGGLAAMGGGVDLKKEVDGFKKSLKDLATLVDAFKEEAENRFMAIDREMEVLNTLPDMEQKMKMFEKKLGPENVERLRMLISSADDLKDEVLPLLVKRETEEKVEPFAKKVKNVEETNEKINAKFAEILLEMKEDKKDIKGLYKWDERIAKIEDSLAEIKKGLTDLRSAVNERDKVIKNDMLDHMKETLPKIINAESNNIRKEFSGRFTFVEDKLQSIDNTISESHREISELAALKGEFDILEDKLKNLEEEDNKIAGRTDALKERDLELRESIEQLQTPKEIITELDNKTKDILEIREFFVRRADGLEERINQLDERAVPTKKLHDKVDNIFNNLTDLRKNQELLGQKFEAEKKELQKIITQHADEKKKLEGKLQEQRIRISTLLKEFK